MSKEYVIGFSVGLVPVLAPIFIFRWTDGDWLRGALISISLGSWVSALGYVPLLAKAMRRLLSDRDRRQKGSANVL